MARTKEFDEKVVLQKAMELFWQKGYQSVSFNDLVEQMGIHRKSIYDTYGDKRSLYLKSLEFYKNMTLTRLKSYISSTESPREILQGIYDYTITGIKDGCGCFLVNATTEMASNDPEVEKIVESAYSETEYLLKEVIQRGQEIDMFSTKFKADELAAAMHNSLLGIRVLKRTSVSHAEMKQVAQFFLRLLD